MVFTVGVVGGTGFLGQQAVPAMLSIVKMPNWPEPTEIRILTSKKSETTKEYENLGAKVFQCDLQQTSSGMNGGCFQVCAGDGRAPAVQALIGCDAVISFLGKRGDGLGVARKNLINFMAQAGVKIYIPSEFGCDHYTYPEGTQQVPEYRQKVEHYEAAVAKGLKVIRLATGLLYDIGFGSVVKSPKHEWQVPGSGKVRVAMTSRADAGLFALEAARLATHAPEQVPSLLQVYSECRTIEEYAADLGDVLQSTIELVHTPIEELQRQFAQTPTDFLMAIRVQTALGSMDFIKSRGNDLLNPRSSVWFPTTVKEYAAQLQKQIQ